MPGEGSVHDFRGHEFLVCMVEMKLSPRLTLSSVTVHQQDI